VFIEFIDQFRCTSDHEQSWLVATFLEREDRFLVRGTLGCHICLRQFPVEHGVAYFGAVPADPQESVAHSDPLQSDAETAMRVAAFLGAVERASLVVTGSWARQAHELVKILPMRIFAMNSSGVIQETESIAVFESTEGIPLTANTIHGVALDVETATPINIQSALKVLRPNGRLLVPVSVPVPPEITELARDEEYWIGEKSGELISLRRA
jgi:hypothetical protein